MSSAGPTPALPPAPFGRLLTAMVTPFTAAGALDEDGAAQLATHLVEQGCEGIVVSGTTGESPTTSDAEKDRLVRAVVAAVAGRAQVLAGVGTADTAHSVALARAAAAGGATGLLAVTPYYSRPPQAGLLAHFTAIADATELPVLLYDIPARSGVALGLETLRRLAEHPAIAAVKDATGDVAAASRLRATSDLAIYSGDDVLTLPLLAVGGCGVVSVVAHAVAGQLAAMIAAVDGGRLGAAREANAALIPAYDGFFRTQGAILAKAACRLLDLPAGPVRLPLVDATDEQVEVLRRDLLAAGVALP